MTKKRSEELYEQIYKAIQPIVHGETKNDVVEALGNAFWAMVHAAGATPHGVRLSWSNPTRTICWRDRGHE
jgi:hypothetical protein